MDNLAQEMAGAAALLMGQGAEGIPAVLIRGVSYITDEVDGVRSWTAKPGDLRRLLTSVFLATIRSIGIRGFLGSLFAGR